MYTALAAAFVRGHRPDAPPLPDEALVAWGREQGLKVHKFKRTELPRVQLALGWLRGLRPASLVDVGSGRGVFLWPLLDGFPEIRVTAVERDPIRVRDLRAVARGGIERLEVIEQDAGALSLDVPREGATVLEVLEHVDDPLAVARATLAAAERFVIASVPSQPDDNPEHVRLFTPRSLEALLREAGAARVQLDQVRGHHLALAMR